MAVARTLCLPSHSAFTAGCWLPPREQRKKSDWEKTYANDNNPSGKPCPVGQSPTFSACDACHSTHLLTICIVLSIQTTNSITKVVLEHTAYISRSVSEYLSNASWSVLPSICMTIEAASTAPPGLKRQAPRKSKCKTEFKECSTPHPGHGMWRSFCIRQKWGSRIKTGDITIASSVDSKTPR